MSTRLLTEQIKKAASQLGFDLVGICPAVEPEGLHQLYRWIDAGYAGEMHYFEKRRRAYAHPEHVMQGVRSLIVLGTCYAPSRLPSPASPSQLGRISSYARGKDYHDVLHERLKRLRDSLLSVAPQAAVRGVVDTAPLMEREFAQLAGLGWRGKNSLLLNQEKGSWFFLSVLLTDVELEYDAPFSASHCGTCRACLDACPTGAFVSPGVLDAQKCISYLTIELKGPIPRELRPGMGDWLFGCDVCQEVCPWNSHAERSPSEKLPSEKQVTADGRPDLIQDENHSWEEISAAELLTLDEDSFRRRFRHTPLWRPRRRGLLRNAAIVLGNLSHSEHVPLLQKTLHDVEPLVRGASAWALGSIAKTQADAGRASSSHEIVAALKVRLALETDASVQKEIKAALRMPFTVS